MRFILLFTFSFLFANCEKETINENNSPPIPQEELMEIRYLALGDSYTIGEGVPENQRWPVLLSQQLLDSGIQVEKVEIVAATGWTTRNLINAIEGKNLDKSYDLVSLLIGVNNQYQGKSIEEYRKEFAELLNTAIELAGGKEENVFVLSIPDYSVTPFARGRDISKIAEEIEAFNSVNKEIAEQKRVKYFNITPLSQNAKNDPALLAEDQLHPSGKMYGQWVEFILPEIVSIVKEE